MITLFKNVNMQTAIYAISIASVFGAVLSYLLAIKFNKYKLYSVFILYIFVALAFSGAYYNLYIERITYQSKRLTEIGKYIYSIDSLFHENNKELEYNLESLRNISSDDFFLEPFIFNTYSSIYNVDYKGIIKVFDPEKIKEEIVLINKILKYTTAPSVSGFINDKEKEILLRILNPYPKPEFLGGIANFNNIVELINNSEIKWEIVLPLLIKNKNEIISFWSKRSIEQINTNSQALRDWNSSGSTYINFIYFSFVTITTLGYGDVLPNDSSVRILVVLELIIGLFIVVFFITSIGKDNK